MVAAGGTCRDGVVRPCTGLQCRRSRIAVKRENDGVPAVAFFPRDIEVISAVME